MVNNYMGTIFVGSSDLQISVANTEILTDLVFNLSIQVDNACHVIINGGDPVYFRANHIELIDKAYSFKIVENNIPFNWSGVIA